MFQEDSKTNNLVMKHTVTRDVKHSGLGAISKNGCMSSAQMKNPLGAIFVRRFNVL